MDFPYRLCVWGLAPWTAEYGIFDEMQCVCEQQVRFASFPLVRVATTSGTSWNIGIILYEIINTI